MPRINPRDFIRAATINTALPSLLPVCRDLASARNELRWLQEHAIAVSQHIGQDDHTAILRGLIQRRAHGEPLQYIVGTEFFGNLEIKCRPGVLIPRPETATSVSHLVNSLAYSGMGKPQSPSPLRILDLCTGSGCIPLLFHYEYYKDGRRNNPLELVGVDISSKALSLARENLIHQIAIRSKKSDGASPGTRSLRNIGFVQANVLAHEGAHSVSRALQILSSDPARSCFDVLISNPPYISPGEFKRTPRSVRNYEPRVALVPPVEGDVDNGTTADLFYPRLLKIAEQVKAKIALLEVSHMEQAKRVVSQAIEQQYWTNIEIWRDDPSGESCQGNPSLPNGQQVKLRGSGHGRSVFLYREDAAGWLKIRP